MDMVIDIAERTLIEHANGRVDWCDPRQMLTKSPSYPDLQIKYKGCFLPGLGIAGSRVVGLNRTAAGKEVARRRPSKFVLLTDPVSGAFLAIIDESGSYAWRTGAGVAIAAKHLAQPEIETIAMIGSGDMAEASLLAMCTVRRPRQVRVYSRTPENRAKFAEHMAGVLDVAVMPTDTAEAAIRGAQLICSATTATQPFIQDAWLEPGSMIYSMGEFQELETAAYLNTDKFVVDDWEQVKIKVDIKELMARGEIGDEDVHADFAALVSGTKPGRERQDERILVRSQGLVTQDIAIGWAVYQKALECGIGRVLVE
jgi:ornithine cyclodeaminase/alanine dehydrogenase-like protein (mu-crystallin family)